MVELLANQQIWRVQNICYRWGNKAGRLLAKLTCQNQPYKSILKLQNPDMGDTTSKWDEIAMILWDYYKNLYRATPSNSVDIQTFLNILQLPTLTRNERDLLDSLAIQEEEICATIMSSKNGKTQVLMVFRSNIISYYLQKLFALWQKYIMPFFLPSTYVDRFNESRTILLPKPNKDHTNPASYRPISLLNQDYKLLSKALADRLQLLLPQLLHTSQTGFTQGRNSIKNIRTAIAAIVMAQ